MKHNLVLIGMPGAGKSAVSSLLARQLNLIAADTDAMVEQAAGLSIPALFQTWGEAHFRMLEAEAARRAAALCGAVIATGGGLVLRPDNVAALRRTGLMFFLDRPPEHIAAERHDARPLIGSDRARVFDLYRQRISCYRACADYIIRNEISAAHAAAEIAAIWNKRREETP